MRVALLHPIYRPEVHGPVQRLVHGLGVELARRGHDVTLLTSHRAARAIAVEDGIRVVRSRRLPQPVPLRWHEHHVTNASNVVRRLAGSGFDLAHAFFPVDACAAQLARDWLGGPPVIFSLHRIPTRPFLVRRRYRLEMIDRAVNRADAASAPSDAAAEAVARYFGRRVDVIPAETHAVDWGAIAARYEALYARVIAARASTA